VVLVFAGPNGSGKTTASLGTPALGTYVNADDIQAEAGCTDLEAAQQATALREKLLAAGDDFTFETVLSTDRNLDLLRRARAAGYEIRSVFVLTVSPSLNVARVLARVAAGGRAVPEAKIRARYTRSLANLPELVALSDIAIVLDNTSDNPVQIFAKDQSGFFIEQTTDWPQGRILRLVGFSSAPVTD
jgi:predicted ABC-type ATPase